MKKAKLFVSILLIAVLFISCSSSPNQSADEDAGPLCFTAFEAGSTVKVIKGGDPDPISLVYSTDGNTWKDYTIDEEITLENVGDKVFFKAKTTNKAFLKDNTNFYGFRAKGLMNLSGNIMYLLDSTGKQMSIEEKSAFEGLFEQCDLRSVKDLVLPATELSEACYKHMFQSCEKLIDVPKLPATTMQKNCYYGMFSQCKVLTDAPELPATNLAESCYESMFDQCKNLLVAPELPATTLAKSCYSNMFTSCTTLIAAPKLPATVLEETCYKNMFVGCNNLCFIDVSFTDWADMSDATAAWLESVRTTGTFTCPSSLDQTTRDVAHVPDTWTIVEK